MKRHGDSGHSNDGMAVSPGSYSASNLTGAAQSVKTTEIGGPERGYDGGKKINGRKQHLLVDTLGLLIAVLMTSAGLDDGVAAPRLLAHVTPADFPRLATICADQ